MFSNTVAYPEIEGARLINGGRWHWDIGATPRMCLTPFTAPEVCLVKMNKHRKHTSDRSPKLPEPRGAPRALANEHHIFEPFLLRR
jgi:hypothetical protein